jgi:hypothetical protein
MVTSKSVDGKIAFLCFHILPMAGNENEDFTLIYIC